MLGFGFGQFSAGREQWTQVNLVRNSVAPFWDETSTNTAGQVLAVNVSDPLAVMIIRSKPGHGPNVTRIKQQDTEYWSTDSAVHSRIGGRSANW